MYRQEPQPKMKVVFSQLRLYHSSARWTTQYPICTRKRDSSFELSLFYELLFFFNEHPYKYIRYTKKLCC